MKDNKELTQASSCFYRKQTSSTSKLLAASMQTPRLVETISLVVLKRLPCANQPDRAQDADVPCSSHLCPPSYLEILRQ